jgi:multiple sugar transport system ATP-binding protein
MTMSDRVAVMIDGRLLQVGTPQEVYADPAHVDVARFVGSPRINLLAAAMREPGIVDVAGARFPFDGDAAVGDRLLAGIRPESLTPGTRAAPDSIAGRVVLVEHLGSDLFVHVDVPGQVEPVIARATPQSAGAWEVGQVIHLAADADRLLMFRESGERLLSRRERRIHARASA